MEDKVKAKNVTSVIYLYFVTGNPKASKGKPSLTWIPTKLWLLYFIYARSEVILFSIIQIVES